MNNVIEVARQVAILFVLMGAGAVMRKAKFFEGSAIDGLVNVLIHVVTPCLIIDVFQRPYDPSMLTGLGVAFVVAVLGHLLAIVGAKLCVRHPNEDVRRPLLLAAVFSNAGFMGVPLEQAILGDEGVFYGVVYIAVFNLFMWSWGLETMRKEKGKGKSEKGKGKSEKGEKLDLHAFINPGTVGLAVGLPLFFLSVKLPAIVSVPVHHLANLNTPLAMIVIGHYLAGAKLGPVLRLGGVYVASGFRMVAYPLAMIAILYPFRRVLCPAMMLAMVIAASAPVAAMVSMFAAKFNRDIPVSVAVASGTTLFSILTMPPVIALAMTVLTK